MKNQGFMLIETIIYIGLFAIMIGGLLISASFLMKDFYSNNAELTTEEEMNFVIQKLNWVLNSAKSLTVTEDGHSLHIINPSIYSEEIIFKYDEVVKKIDLKINNEGFLPITTQNVSVLNNNYTPTKFIKLESSGMAPTGISIFLNIDGQSINFIKYLNYEDQ